MNNYTKIELFVSYEDIMALANKLKKHFEKHKDDIDQFDIHLSGTDVLFRVESPHLQDYLDGKDGAV